MYLNIQIEGKKMSQQTEITDIIKKLTKEIENRLGALHWSISRLALESNTSYDTLKKIVAGKVTNPSFCTIISICQCLDISLDHIIFSTSNDFESITPLEDESPNADELSVE